MSTDPPNDQATNSETNALTSAPAPAIAIVGMGGVFAGCGSPAELWRVVNAAADVTRPVTGGRWAVPVADVLAPGVALADRVYTDQVGATDAQAASDRDRDTDPGVGQSPEASQMAALDPVFSIALRAARQAWRGARADRVDRARAGVVFGNIVLPTETASALGRTTAPPETRTKAKSEAQARADAQIEAASGPNRDHPLNAFPAGLPAAVVAEALGLKGPAYTLDAACGSSLYALALAVDELRSGRADLMICGGASRPDSLYTQMGFAQLRALSPRGRAAPLDQRADGLIVGEGAAMFALKRLEDALEHGDHILATIAGIGLSNDVHGDLLAPEAEGQLRAMRAAYQQAGWSPADVDLIECHATGTPRGDAVEAESLRTLWGETDWRPGQCVVGSIKGNIGHALTAAGAAGLLKALLAIEHQTFPPTANLERPIDGLDPDTSPFRALKRPAAWPLRPDGRPRRAAVSAFGFGGINAHALIEEWRPSAAASSSSSPRSAGREKRATSDRAMRAAPALAIVGAAVQLGDLNGQDAVRELLFGQSRDSAEAEAESMRPRHRLTSLEFRVDQFRIPPRELAEMLPQQSLMLRVAAEAISGAGWAANAPRAPRLHTGVLIGIGLDLNTTNFQRRWTMLEHARERERALGLGLSPEELARWAGELRDASGPPLTANRTMGSLGGLVASRIAREFQLGGPSFTVSRDELSGVQALAIAAQWLRLGVLDSAIVGAVDLPSEPRALTARLQWARRRNAGQAATSGPRAIADAAVCLVLKRLDDARREGDPIVAVLDRIEPDGSRRAVLLARSDEAPGERPDRGASAPSRAPVLFPSDWAGAAGGLIAVARAALALQHQVVPPNVGADAGRDANANAPRHWLRNRSEGPRRAEVAASSLIDDRARVWLVEAPGPEPIEEKPASRSSRPGSAGPARSLMVRAHGLFALEADEVSGLIERGRELIELCREAPETPIDALSRRWRRGHPNNAERTLGWAFLAQSAATLQRAVEQCVNAGFNGRHREGPDDRPASARGEAEIFAPMSMNETVARPPHRLAFVYPGLGNHFEGMGRELALLFPNALSALDAESQRLRDQFSPEIWWDGPHPARFHDHRTPILGQIALGCLVTDVLLGLGVAPRAAIGYSMGESAALVALRAWRDRDGMMERLLASPLFARELAGPCDAARRVWGARPDEPIQWAAGVVPRPAADVRAAIASIGARRADVLIANTARETVLGGDRPEIARVVRELGCFFVELPNVSTVHCPIGRSVEADYRALHDLETFAPPDIAFYSGVWGRPYELDRRSAADAIGAQASRTIDFPALIERAYRDGADVFIEIGPGGSCTRLVREILGDRPHAARSACRADRGQFESVLAVLGLCVANRLPVALDRLDDLDVGQFERAAMPMNAGTGRAGAIATASGPRSSASASSRLVRVEVERPNFVPPPPPPPQRQARDGLVPAMGPEDTGDVLIFPRDDWKGRDDDTGPTAARPIAFDPFQDDLAEALARAESARIDAHRAYLRTSQDTSALIARHIDVQLDLIEAWHQSGGGASAPPCARSSAMVGPSAADPTPTPAPAPAPSALFDRTQCLELAVGSVASVFGPDFAPVDALPVRVRLPDEPLMLVDRIIALEGAPRSLDRGRIVTEHVIEPGAWYLDGGRIAPCIAMEAGQADLVLSGFLGVDFETRGKAFYRLLDATVTFHRELPAPGAVVRYDIRITRFFRQGPTILFRFEYDATVAGEPLIAMRDGCAGFFTHEELAAGKGIVAGALRVPAAERPAGAPVVLAPIGEASEALDERSLAALRRGDLAAAFGPAFGGTPQDELLPLPDGRMALVDRVMALLPNGGRAGLGLARAEADVRDDAWFLECHFVDDRVMPGTLMYETCLHLLRIYMMRLGWIGRRGEAAYGPVPGVANRLKCRGQIAPGTRKVVYEIQVKERGLRGEGPYAIADALIAADGKPIVAVDDLALQLSGADWNELEAFWRGRRAGADGRRK